MIQLISVSEIASSINLSKQSIFNNLKALDIEVVKHKNKAYISNDEDLQRLLKRLEDNNKGMFTKILESDNQNINKHVVNLINAESSSNIIGLSDTVDELNKQLDELIKENDRLIENNKTLNNEVTSLRTELNSLDKNKSEVIQLLKSQIEDMKQSHEKEIKRLEDDKENLQNNIDNLDERLKESLNLVSQQQSLALKLQSDLDTLEVKQSQSDVSNHVNAEREDKGNQKQSQSFLSRLFKR